MSVLDLFELKGKTALVTGCRRGIGRAIAVALAKAGADIIGVSANLESTGSDIEKAVTAAGRRFSAHRCDFADRAALKLFIDKLADSPIDILVNNAGTIRRAPAAEHPEDYWDKVVETNLTAQFLLTKAVGRRMLDSGGGKIIFIASLLSFQGGINVPGYAASKGGVAQLTRALANEWASHNINVNAIAPGYVSTDNTAALRDDTDRSKAILDRIPVGRWGKPEDFAGPAVFLASAASDYVNGEIIAVDGGWLSR
jgi:2-deoxy-D-gluconate 3-dehydrogenase